MHAKYVTVLLKFEQSHNSLPFPNRFSTDETCPFSLSSMGTFYMAFQISCVIKLAATNITRERPYKETDTHSIINRQLNQMGCTDWLLVKAKVLSN